MSSEQIPDDIVLSPNETVAEVIKFQGQTLLATNRRIVHRRSTLLESDEKVYPIRTTDSVQTRTQLQRRPLTVGFVLAVIGLGSIVIALNDTFNLSFLLFGLLLLLGGGVTMYTLATRTTIVIQHAFGEEIITVARSKKAEAERFSQIVSAILAGEAW